MPQPINYYMNFTTSIETVQNLEFPNSSNKNVKSSLQTSQDENTLLHWSSKEIQVSSTKDVQHCYEQFLCSNIFKD